MSNGPKSKPATPELAHASSHTFICIARQTGIDIPTLSSRLAEKLNGAHSNGPTWTVWDTELVNKIATQLHIPTSLVEQSEGRYSWIDDFLATLADRTDQMAIYHRLSATIRLLIQDGPVILVGHGSHFITRGMPGGLHVRLVSPWPTRVQTIARTFDVPHDRAERQLKALHRNRIGYFRRYWPEYSLDPEEFAATLNAGILTEEQLVNAIMALVPKL